MHQETGHGHIHTKPSAWKQDWLADMPGSTADTYPLGDEFLIPIGADALNYHRRLLRASPRLFSSTEIVVELIEIFSKSGGRGFFWIKRCIWLLYLAEAVVESRLIRDISTLNGQFEVILFAADQIVIPRC
jgi:hypothetical protein